MYSHRERHTPNFPLRVSCLFPIATTRPVEEHDVATSVVFHKVGTTRKGRTGIKTSSAAALAGRGERFRTKVIKTKSARCYTLQSSAVPEPTLPCRKKAKICTIKIDVPDDIEPFLMCNESPLVDFSKPSPIKTAVEDCCRSDAVSWLEVLLQDEVNVRSSDTSMSETFVSQNSYFAASPTILSLMQHSKLFHLLLRASPFMDGYTIAAIYVLLQRSGLSSAGSSPLTTHALDTAVAIAFMLTLKMDEEAVDRCLEKGLWQILASFIFFGTVPQLAGSGLEKHYLATNPRLDEKCKLLHNDELSFLRKIDWRCHVGLHERQWVLDLLSDSSEGGKCMAQRMRQVPESAMSRTQTTSENDDMNSHFKCMVGVHSQQNGSSGTIARQLFLQDKNECGERTWELLSEILVLMFDTRISLPSEASRRQRTRIPKQLKKVELTSKHHCAAPEDKMKSTGARGSLSGSPSSFLVSMAQMSPEAALGSD